MIQYWTGKAVTYCEDLESEEESYLSHEGGVAHQVDLHSRGGVGRQHRRSERKVKCARWGLVNSERTVTKGHKTGCAVVLSER